MRSFIFVLPESSRAEQSINNKREKFKCDRCKIGERKNKRKKSCIYLFIIANQLMLFAQFILNYLSIWALFVLFLFIYSIFLLLLLQIDLNSHYDFKTESIRALSKRLFFFFFFFSFVVRFRICKSDSVFESDDNDLWPNESSQDAFCLFYVSIQFVCMCVFVLFCVLFHCGPPFTLWIILKIFVVKMCVFFFRYVLLN